MVARLCNHHLSLSHLLAVPPASYARLRAVTNDGHRAFHPPSLLHTHLSSSSSSSSPFSLPCLSSCCVYLQVGGIACLHRPDLEGDRRRGLLLCFRPTNSCRQRGRRRAPHYACPDATISGSHLRNCCTASLSKSFDHASVHNHSQRKHIWPRSCAATWSQRNAVQRKRPSTAAANCNRRPTGVVWWWWR